MSARNGTDIGSPSFPTTVWAQIARAQGRDRKLAFDALGLLVERYWHPVYFFIRQKGKSRDGAKDLTQEFFASFLEKDAISYADETRGRFRTFLLSSVCRFLTREHRMAERKPRKLRLLGSRRDPEEWKGFEPTDSETPEDVFMRNWAKSFLENCVVKLREECEALGKEMHFHVFQIRVLREKPVPRSVVAGELGISVTDVANYLHRAKERFRRIAKEEMLNFVTAPGEADEEINGLLTLLSSHKR